MELDDIDLALLRALNADGRLSASELAAKANVSRGTVYSRLERLQRAGVIRGFTVDVDEHRLGLEVTALVLVSAGQFRWREMSSELAALPEVQFAGYLTGGFDIVLLVRVRDTDALRALVFEKLQSIQGVRSTQTLTVVEEVVDRPNIIPTE
ncbi:Lrp/AsnC family transcriptional regulator [Streptomyces sp. NEAU-Y11]|uniref:Lrp/AsnC family transcriptional regulator n=1 Tax=Streptomyces cucumeris TaxID=2962890 RepID=UPI0020C88CFF|nr:Lrp/AsnC family transcriptional regulator [Streptomyces sp. NEAU-Y11]MCP9211131.1 Lrp/AsnC family transcriptional regulator [Streptomyces sp. NEAU-Y11]